VVDHRGSADHVELVHQLGFPQHQCVRDRGHDQHRGLMQNLLRRSWHPGGLAGTLAGSRVANAHSVELVPQPHCTVHRVRARYARTLADRPRRNLLPLERGQVCPDQSVPQAAGHQRRSQQHRQLDSLGRVDPQHHLGNVDLLQPDVLQH